MLGSIIGDVSGSIYEVRELDVNKKFNYEDRIKVLDKKIPLFIKDDSYTDDSVLTSAIAATLLNNGDYEYYLKYYGQREINLGLDRYGRNRFSNGFINWLNSNNEGKSFGSGGAMRVAPIAYYFDNLEDINLLISPLVDQESLLINIHEYDHAMRLYTKLGQIYEDDTYNMEQEVRQLEKKYIKVIKNGTEISHNY